MSHRQSGWRTTKNPYKIMELCFRSRRKKYQHSHPYLSLTDGVEKRDASRWLCTSDVQVGGHTQQDLGILQRTWPGSQAIQHHSCPPGLKFVWRHLPNPSHTPCPRYAPLLGKPCAQKACCSRSLGVQRATGCFWAAWHLLEIPSNNLNRDQEGSKIWNEWCLTFNQQK